MKNRVLLLLLSLLITICCQAQHLTFSGIPIDGTINAFAQKLAAKGYKVSKHNAALNFPNTRLFEGSYMGENVELYVSYIKSTKIVYEVKVVYDGEKKMYCDNFLEKIRSSIETKYDGRYEKENSKMISDEKAEVYYIYNPLDIYLGSIVTATCYGNYKYASFIIYKDAKNSIKNDDEQLDDI